MTKLIITLSREDLLALAMTRAKDVLAEGQEIDVDNYDMNVQEDYSRNGEDGYSFAFYPEKTVKAFDPDKPLKIGREVLIPSKVDRLTTADGASYTAHYRGGTPINVSILCIADQENIAALMAYLIGSRGE